MDVSRMVTHAFEVVRRHRALWILGLLWVLVGGGGTGGGGGGANVFQYSVDGDEASQPWSGQGDFGRFGPEMERLRDHLAAIEPGQWIAIAVACCTLIVLLVIVTTIVRYVLQTGIFRALDHLDAYGIAPSVRGAWREGWNVRTWRPFVQNLIVDIPFAIAIVAGLAVSALPVLLGVLAEDRSGTFPVASAIAACCMFCGWMLIAVVIGAVLGVLKELWWRAAVLDDQDFLTAMGTGWRLARTHVGDVFLLWLVMIGVGILYMFLTIAVVIAAALLTALVAGVPAYLIYQSTGGLAWPLVWGIPVGLVTFVVPMLLVSGLYLVFRASVWTQAYRALAGPPVGSGDGMVPVEPLAPVPGAAEWPEEPLASEAGTA